MTGWFKVGLLMAGVGALAPPVLAVPPDLSGTWSVPFRVHSSGFPLMSGETPWMGKSQGDPIQYKIPTLDELSERVDVSVKTHDGNPTFAFPPPAPPPLNSAGKDAFSHIDAAKLQAQELNCYPTNVLSRVGGGGQTVQIVQGKGAVAIASDGGGPSRIIYLDGRGQENAVPQWNGHSVGRWEGNTLKVETEKIRGAVMNVFGNWPQSENAKLYEEFSLVNGGRTLKVSATYEDPTYYTESLHKIMYLDRHPELEVTDYTCDEGREDSIANVPPQGNK